MLKTVKRLIPQAIKKPIKSLLHEWRLSRCKQLGRDQLSYIYIRGKGIEIGALHNPLYVSKAARVSYVDRLSLADLRTDYPELRELPLVQVDIIDQGELLSSLDNETQDFVIANHFLEHCQNPLLALGNMFRVLKSQGILYICLPDKRYTFDSERPVTSLEHILEDYRKDPGKHKKDHFEEWVRLVQKVEIPDAIQQETERLMEMDYSIHFHVWTQTEMLEMFAAAKKELGVAFDIEVCLKNGHEFVLVLRKL